MCSRGPRGRGRLGLKRPSGGDLQGPVDMRPPGWRPRRERDGVPQQAAFRSSLGSRPAGLTCLLPLPAGTPQASWAWPPAASPPPSKASSPAPCPCPTACPPCPTHPTRLLLARPSSPRRIETMRATSCSPGGAPQSGQRPSPRTGVCRGSAAGGHGLRDGPGARGERRHPLPASAVVVPSRGPAAAVSSASSFSSGSQ